MKKGATHVETERDRDQQAPNPLAADPFPLLILDVRDGVSNPPRLRNALMQWHEDLQFVVAARGTADIDTPIGHYECGEGQGAFFNSTTPHRVVGRSGSMYMSFVFPAKMLGFFPGSAMQERGVIPYVGDGARPAVYFDGSEPWHAEVIGHLLAAREEHLADGESAASLYRIAWEVVGAWAVYIAHVTPTPPSAATIRLNERMRAFLSFIEAHYGEQVSLDDIAAAGSVGKSECLRCFRKALGTTPVAYLNAYRVSEATEMMRAGEMTVTQIAFACGFSSASYFSKAFRAQVGMSPREYLRALSNPEVG